MSPLAEGLFHRIIALSGNAMCGQYIQQKPKKAAAELARRLDCDEMGVPEMMDCLRSVPVDELVVKSNDMYVSRQHAPFPNSFTFKLFTTIYLFHDIFGS
jgi:carboxylesterase type B